MDGRVGNRARQLAGLEDGDADDLPGSGGQKDRTNDFVSVTLRIVGFELVRGSISSCVMSFHVH